MKDIIDVQIDRRILITLGVILGTALISWIAITLYRAELQDDDLFKREIGGILTSAKDITHGKFTLTIKQHETGEELKYSLSVSKFLRENGIQEGDSVSKESNSHTINFYKKNRGTFYKCCDLYW